MKRSSSSPGSSVSNFSPSRFTALLFPRNYKVVQFLGRGGFGEVFKCAKLDTKEIVAVKIPQPGCSFINELTLLNFFMWKNLDKCNIVRFIDSFTLRDNRAALAFEMLDVTVKDYIIHQRNFNPLELHEVRSIVQQMATALEALKTNEVIHSDIKLDNIMLVDRAEQPLRVKLIDFGLAFPTSKARQGTFHQTTLYRAPEIILGLPFSEAMDMWSLGVVMAFLVLGDVLFPGITEYDALRCIVDLLGVPPDHLLSAGWFTYDYFVQRLSGHWRLKTPEEFWGSRTPPRDYRSYHFRNLDEVENLPLTNLSMVEADEKKECIDLLKAMLQMDADKRITPSQVLTHPFITRGTLQHGFNSETLQASTSCTTEPGTSKTKKLGAIQKADPGPIQATEPGTTNQPPQSDCSLSTEEDREGEYETCSSGFYGSTSSGLPPGLILVRPAPPERCLQLDEDSGQHSEACSLDCLEDSSVNSPVVKNPPPSVPEGSNMEQEDTELTDSTSDDTEPEEEKETRMRTRKRRSSFQRFLTWMRTTFCSCIDVNEEE
ncbi:homeodomain-interacting protein kinase 2-like isoform X1 [Lates japonicus]